MFRSAQIDSRQPCASGGAFAEKQSTQGRWRQMLTIECGAGTTAAQTEIVNGPCQRVLAAAGLAEEEDRHRYLAGQAHLLPESPHDGQFAGPYFQLEALDAALAQ